MVFTLWLPILLCGVALFFASFLSWMVLPIHKKDWVKMNNEVDFMQKVRELDISIGSYTFPGWDTSDEMKSEEFQKKFEKGPCAL